MEINNLFSVKNKVAVVTGGSRGIGEMITSGFLANGAKVYITARKAPALIEKAQELSELYDAEVISNIVAGLDVAQRWGVSEGQLGIASKIINSQVINRIVRQHIDGEIDAVTAVANMNAELAKIE